MPCVDSKDGIDINLVDAVLLNSTRIGHGYAVTKHPVVKQLLATRQIPLEICPISNQVCNMIFLTKFCLKGEGKRFLHGDLICTYILSEYRSGIYVDGLCIISVKLNFETRRDFVRHYLFTAN